MNENLIEYYDKRASEFDLIYQKPERQIDLLEIKKLLQELFVGKSVIEVACGTGFWTRIISSTAEKVFATDINSSVLEIAKQNNYPGNNVTFSQCDIEDISFHPDHNAVFGGFIWSHIKKCQLTDFIKKINSFVPKGSVIAFLDNRYIENSSSPISFTDEEGNTYQKRIVQEEEFLIIKNFPTKQYLYNTVADHGKEINIIETEYYWLMAYKNS